MIKEALPGTGNEPSGTTPRRLRVLVVDDDRDTIVTLLLLLRDEGYDVKSAISADHGWNQIRDFDPDVVLLDIGLPDRNGYDLARSIRSHLGNKRPALIAVTAWNNGADKLLAKMVGFDHHVGKPYDPNQLLALLKSFAIPDGGRYPALPR